MKNILITGATGHLGSSVIAHLLTQIPAHQIFALVRDEAKAAELHAKGVQVRIGNYNDRASLDTALQGIDKVLLISSSDFNDRFGQHKNVVDAAKAAGVQHIAYTGVAMHDLAHSALQPLLGSHAETEAYILESGLPYTFLQNGLYYEVIPMFAGPNVLETGIFFASGKGKVAFVSREDLAEVTAKILASEGHAHKTYSLQNEAASSFGEVAAVLSELSGKSVLHISTDLPSFEAALKQFGLPDPIVGMSVAFAAGIQNREFEETNTTLAQFLGRNPMDLRTFLKAAFQL